MFLHVSVILSTGGCLANIPLGRHPPGRHPPLADTPPWQTPPLADTPGQTPSSCHYSGRYASFWNAFLFSSRSSEMQIRLSFYVVKYYPIATSEKKLNKCQHFVCCDNLVRYNLAHLLIFWSIDSSGCCRNKESWLSYYHESMRRNKNAQTMLRFSHLVLSTRQHIENIDTCTFLKLHETSNKWVELQQNSK